MSDKKWFPLESNPEVMNKYLATLGVTGGVVFNDIFGLDPELLCMVPPPVRSVLLLFPISANNEAAQAAAHAAQAAAGAADAAAGVYFMRQTIGNACGTIGILHALANNGAHVQRAADGFFARFVGATAKMSPAERAAFVEGDTELDTAQGDAAAAGQTANQDIDARINLHFIAYVEHAGVVYELDGRQAAPLAVGAAADGGLLAVAARKAQAFMALDPAEVNFSLVALSGDEAQ
jgi:ubiquitin carboxyl-terminal hydrolase L3